jgi:hypothetical protein
VLADVEQPEALAGQPLRLPPIERPQGDAAAVAALRARDQQLGIAEVVENVA